MALAALKPKIAKARREYQAALETCARLATELCNAIDCQAEDVGGTRSTLAILQELGPACGRVEATKKAQDQLLQRTR